MMNWLRYGRNVFIVPLVGVVVLQSCNNDIFGRVLAVQGREVIWLHEGGVVRRGDTFSLWRDQQEKGVQITRRTAIIEVVQPISGDTVSAVIVSGKPKAGDRVTRWLIPEETSSSRR